MPPEPNVKLDPERTWVRASRIAQVAVVSGLAVAGYMRFEHRMGRVEENQIEDRSAIVKGLGEVRDQLNKVFIDSVATRQAMQWIENARALNREKYPTLIWPDLPR